MTKDDIMMRLRKGETVEDIVEDFTAAINAAEAAIKEETERKRKDAERQLLAQKACDAMNAYVAAWAKPGEKLEKMTPADLEAITKAFFIPKEDTLTDLADILLKGLNM